MTGFVEQFNTTFGGMFTRQLKIDVGSDFVGQVLKGFIKSQENQCHFYYQRKTLNCKALWESV